LEKARFAAIREGRFFVPINTEAKKAILEMRLFLDSSAFAKRTLE